MPTLELRVRVDLERFAFDALFGGLAGWTPAAPAEFRAGEGAVRLRVLARRGRWTAYLHEAAPGEPPAPYALRRAVQRRLERRGRAVSVFVDALHTVQHWQWTEREPGRAPALRAMRLRRGEPADGVAGRLLALQRASAADDDPAPGAVPSPTAAIGAAVLPALLAAVARRYPEIGTRIGLPASGWTLAGGVALGHALHEAVEASDDPRLALACWRALVEPGFAVLDPRCGDGERLLQVAALLEPLLEVCVERATAWLDDAARLPPPQARALRRLAEQAPQPARRWSVRILLLRRLLFGADPALHRVAVARARLALLVLTEAPPGADPPPPPNLRAGALDLGALSWRRFLGRAHAVSPAAADEAEAVARATAMLRAQPPAPADPAALRAAEEELWLRRIRLQAVLGVGAGHSAAPTRRPLQTAIEFGDVLQRGGFSVVLPVVRTTTRTRLHFAGASG